MELDRHIVDTATVAARLVNLLTPGQAHGRAYDAAQVDSADVSALLAGPDRPAPRTSDDQALAFARLAARLRPVFEAAERGDVASAAGELNTLLADSGARPQLDHTAAGWNLQLPRVD